MVLWPLLLSLPLAATAAGPVAKTFGVAPDLIDKYTSSPAGTWKCLDGSKDIPWDFVNDDSCDCSDGSDEPGSFTICVLLFCEIIYDYPNRHWGLP